MAAGIELYNDVLNQKGSPALYSDTFANRPAFGFTGRLFISTDTNEIYRDTGTGWVLISGGGGVNIYNSNGSLTAARTVTMAGHDLSFEGGASVNRIIMSANNNVARIFSFRTGGVQRWDFRVDGNETGSNTGADWALRAYDDTGTFIFAPITVRRRTGEIECFADEVISTGGASVNGISTNTTGTYNAGLTTFGGNPHASNFNIFTVANAGNLTFNDSNLVGTTVNVFVAQGNNAGTVSFTPSGTGGLRAATNYVSQLQYNTSVAAITYTHAANLHLQGIYERVGGNAWTITNAYQLLINDLNENNYTSARIVLTNRWGIYQNSTLDPNYFGSRVQIGSTTNTGDILQLAGFAFSTLGYKVTDGTIDFRLSWATGNIGFLGTLTNHPVGIYVNTNEVLRMNVLGNIGISQTTFGTSATRTLAISTGVAPTSSPADCFQLYSRDITAGNAAAHFRTENGAVVKIYQETTGVAAATRVGGGGTTITDTDTFGGYTLQQIAQALRNLGILA